MRAADLISCLPVKQIKGTLPNEILDIAVDSRSVQQDCVFICIKGYTVDGHDFVEQAIANGARIIISEKNLEIDFERVALVIVNDTTRAVGLLASKF